MSSRLGPHPPPPPPLVPIQPQRDYGYQAGPVDTKRGYGRPVSQPFWAGQVDCQDRLDLANYQHWLMETGCQPNYLPPPWTKPRARPNAKRSGLPSKLGQFGTHPDSKVCLPRRGLRSSSGAIQAFRGSSSKGSGPMQNSVQTTPPDSSFSPSAVMGSQLSSQHHSLRKATHEAPSALPHCSVVHGITTVVFPSGTQ